MARWTREHEARRAAILDLLSRQAKAFDDMSDEAQDARRALPFLHWCQTYLPHYFSAPFTRAHERMADAAGEPGMPTFVNAFRGFGKSVLLALSRPLYRTLRREVPYWLYGAGVQLLAAQNMDYLRLELDHNERIRADYPEVRVDGKEEEWIVDLGQGQRDAAGRWARRKCKFEAFGIGMSPRGRRFVADRPLEFVGDDLENAELARNPRREQQLWDWMMDEVVPALEPESYIFTVLGTMFGPMCMMERARAKAGTVDDTGRPLVRIFVQAAQDESGASVWPERFPDQELRRIRLLVGPRNWLRNYALKPDDPDAPFQPGWFGLKYSRKDLRVDDLDRVGFLDPAISESASGCPRALVWVGADPKTGERYVLDARIGRASPQDMIGWIFDGADRWRPRMVGVESNGGYALIKPLLEQEEERRRRRLPVRYVNQVTNKQLRIEALCPEMETGRWLWPDRPSEGVNLLVDQFIAYPNGFVDGPDATASAAQMLPDAYRPVRDVQIHKSLGKRRNLAGVI